MGWGYRDKAFRLVAERLASPQPSPSPRSRTRVSEKPWPMGVDQSPRTGTNVRSAKEDYRPSLPRHSVCCARAIPHLQEMLTCNGCQRVPLGIGRRRSSPFTVVPNTNRVAMHAHATWDCFVTLFRRQAPGLRKRNHRHPTPLSLRPGATTRREKVPRARYEQERRV